MLNLYFLVILKLNNFFLFLDKYLLNIFLEWKQKILLVYLYKLKIIFINCNLWILFIFSQLKYL